MADLTLEDLTKEELILLIHKLPFPFSQRELRRIRFNSLVSKAKAMAEEAQKEMKANIGGDRQNLVKYCEASDKFDRAMKLYDEADKMITG